MKTVNPEWLTVRNELPGAGFVLNTRYDFVTVSHPKGGGKKIHENVKMPKKLFNVPHSVYLRW